VNAQVRSEGTGGLRRRPGATWRAPEGAASSATKGRRARAHRLRAAHRRADPQRGAASAALGASTSRWLARRRSRSAQRRGRRAGTPGGRVSYEPAAPSAPPTLRVSVRRQSPRRLRWRTPRRGRCKSQSRISRSRRGAAAVVSPRQSEALRDRLLLPSRLSSLCSSLTTRASSSS